jgi:hypothetical protein
MLIGKPEGKRSFGRPRRRRGDNIGMEWTYLALVNTVMNLGDP